MFPLLLDFLYGLNYSSVTIGSAAALFCPADYLQVNSLLAQILDFWKCDLTVDDLALTWLRPSNRQLCSISKPCRLLLSNCAVSRLRKFIQNGAWVKKSDRDFCFDVLLEVEKTAPEHLARPPYFALFGCSNFLSFAPNSQSIIHPNT